MTADESDAAKEDLWLTYQNYDPAVKQAVRRLGALPGNNIEEFRTLLLASRERGRVKEFEADVVRRLQGEAFVDDEVLQQTLIVLHAENPALAEQFKTFVAANGRPDDIDLAVARLRSGTNDPVMPERLPRKPRETPVMTQVVAAELTPDIPAPEAPTPRPVIPAGEIPAPARVPAEEKRPRPSSPPPSPAPVFADRPAARKIDDAPRTSWTKYAALAAVLLLIGAAGLFFAMPSLFPESGGKQVFEATTAPLRQAAAEDKQSPAAEPAKSAPLAPAPPAPQAQNEVKIPEPPPPSEPPVAAPPLRQAAPDASPGDNSANNSTNAPVPGSPYRVVKGDMLSAIALQAYGDASLFRLIQRANPELRNADHIYYDQMITLPPKP